MRRRPRARGTVPVRWPRAPGARARVRHAPGGHQRADSHDRRPGHVRRHAGDRGRAHAARGIPVPNRAPGHGAAHGHGPWARPRAPDPRQPPGPGQAPCPSRIPGPGGGPGLWVRCRGDGTGHRHAARGGPCGRVPMGSLAILLTYRGPPRPGRPSASNIDLIRVAAPDFRRPAPELLPVSRGAEPRSADQGFAPRGAQPAASHHRCRGVAGRVSCPPPRPVPPPR